LIEAYNVEIISVEGDFVIADYLESEVGEKIPRIHWVASRQNIPFEVIVTGPLLIDESYNPQSLRIAKGKAELSAETIAENEIFQFVRFGFCRHDKPGKAILAHK
jgi:hypothetical protein